MNNDPYKVLGVSKDAGEDEIKAAYRKLAKKYHPDQYEDNPLKDVAAEKMEEINAAYDAIISERRGNYNTSYSSNSSYAEDSQSQSQNYGPSYSDNFDSGYVRNLIQNGNITQAEQILDGIASRQRDAEWYFLKGSVYYKRGWLSQAYTCFARATTMQPNNQEYAAAYRNMTNQRQGGMAGNPYQQRTAAGPSGCDCCTSLCLADCCCECMGGDLIPCC